MGWDRTSLHALDVPYICRRDGGNGREVHIRTLVLFEVVENLYYTK